MEINYNDLLSTVLVSIEEALGVGEDGLGGIYVQDEDGNFYDSDSEFYIPGFGDGEAGVDVEFSDLSFMSDYYNGDKVSMSFNVEEDKAVIFMHVGSDCSNPAIANEEIERYHDSMSCDTWCSPYMFERGMGLMLVYEFKYKTLEGIRAGFTKGLSLLVDDRFTNRLRPFIHYFDN